MIRTKILEYAQDRFFCDGFMSVSMDEIASHLGISKKTIYQHFSSKNKLIEEGIRNYILVAMMRYKNIVNSPMEYIDKLYKIFGLVGNTYLKMGASFRNDVRVRRPDIWLTIEQIRRKTIFESITTFINKGIEQGVVRPGIHPELLIIAFIGALQSIDESEECTHPPESSIDAVDVLTRVMLDGIVKENTR
jgi:AcrR family transcriptional regulator